MLFFLTEDKLKLILVYITFSLCFIDTKKNLHRIDVQVERTK